ncbi:hypothetical protein CHS0354_039776 [Potamilus streckersoni]|uniref:Uncharacterized protein n=1 Tax=Potamilus streckersoni TaxID=2493646 RepID=A0AAE0RZW7_9BIVA|nr:hypothetical protein CHS0354_039776 [Potamilus streckersoni]
MCFERNTPLCMMVFILLVFCFITDLIGFAIPYWYKAESNISGIDLYSYGGLWKFCKESSNFTSCVNEIDDGFAGWFHAVRTFSTLSWMFSLTSLILVVLFFFYDRAMMYLASVCLSFVGAFCALTAFLLYAVKSSGDQKKFYSAFTLIIIAFLLGLMTGIVGIVDFLLHFGDRERH